MAYKLTPEQYKDAARNRVTSQNTAENTNSAVSAYARALNMRRALDNKNRGNTVQNEELAKPDEDQNDENWFVRTLSTIVAPVVRFNEGMFKFVESAVLDLGAGLTASVLDLFGADETAKEVQSWAAQDLVGEAFEWEPIQAIYSNSYSNEWGKFGEILQEGIYTVGQQAIPIALNLLTGGTAGTALSMGTFAMGAYGGAFEQASQEGGSVLGASAYGLISAGIETGIEYLFGSLGGSKVIKSGIDKAVSSLAKSEAGQQVFRFLIDNVAGEGLEEVASGLVENYIKAMTYKGDYSSVEAYFNNILSAPPATQEELWEQFILGAFAGGLMGGGARVITKTSPTLSTAETIQEIDELKEKGYNLSLRGKDTVATELQLTAKENELMERVNKNFDRFTERRKAGNTADGILSFMEQNFNTDENGHFISSKNALIHSENASYGIGQAELNDALGANGRLHEGSFEGEALLSKQKVEKALKNINASLRKDRLKVVFADMSDVQDYGYIKNNVIVVNAAHLGTQLEFKVTENGEVNTYKADAGLSTLLHEVLHFTDDTKAGKQLRELLNKYATEQKTDAIIENVALAANAIQNKQSFDFNGELSARQLEHLLFNENIINQLTEDNSSLSKRILNKATRLLNTLKGEKLAETKELRTLLGKTVKLYNKAIAQVGKGKRIYSKGVDKEDAQPRHSIRVIDGEEIVVIDTDQDIFEGKEKSDYPKIVRQYMVKKFRGKVLNVGENKTYINRNQLEEYTFPANRRLDEDIKAAKMKAGTELDNLLKVAKYLGHTEDDGRHPEAIRGWDKYATRFVVDHQMFEAEISIELVARGDLFYDMTKIKNITPDSRRSMSPTTSQSDVVEGKPSTNSISEENENVNSFDENSSKNNSNEDIRRSRRILNEEEMRQAIDDVVEMLTVIGNVDENTFDVTVNKSSLLSSYMAKINELSAKGKLTENSKVVTRLVESIFNSAVMTEHYTDEVKESALTLDILRRHIHSIDLTTDSIKPEIQNEYGKSNNIFRLWSKKGGVAWDTAVQEIVEELPHLQKDSDIETLYNIFNTYTKCVADLKQVRKQVSELVKNASEAKRLMARSLVLSLSEKGTELVTKVTSEKLQSAITEERKALRDTLSAIKSGKTVVAFARENISPAVKEQFQTVVELVANERAQRYAAKKAESVVFHIKKGVTGEELRDIRKTTAYQALESYIAERRLSEGKEVTIKSIEENAPTLIQSMQRSISAVRSIRDVHANNAEVLRGLLALDTNSLKKYLTELYAEETYLSSVDELESGIKGLFKTSVDGKNILLSYDEMISSGALKNAVNSFLSYYTETNPILQDMVDSGLFEQMQEKIKAYAEYVDILSGQKYSEMSLAEKQTFNNQLTNFLSSVLRATKPIATVTVNGETVSAAKYRDKSLRAIDMMMQRDKNGNYRPESRALAAFSAKYLQDSVRPYEAIALAENHSGALEALFNEIREGAIKGENARADLEDIVFNFAQDKNNKNGNKKYSNILMSEEVTIKHSEGEFVVTRGELVGLYLTLSQEDGFLHADALNPFAEGIYFDNKNMSTNYRNKMALKFTAENLVSLENQLTETDFQFIEKVREFLKNAGELKGEVDMQLYGMKRLLGEDYYPLQTDESARTSKLGDKVSFYDALDPSGHLSINQSRTSGLKALRVRNVADQLTSYAKSVGLYYGVAVPIANMRLVYNSKGVNGESIKSFIAKHSTKEFDPYLDKLLLDVQGAIKVSDSFMERQRQRYAAFAIAANIKSPIKALGGLFSLTGKLKTTSFLKGLVKSPFSLIKSGKVDFSQMYEYCPATRIRYRDRQATLSAMNVEGVSKLKNSIVDKLAIGIELVDKYTVYVAWNAAKAEVGAVGVNANNSDYLKRAGKLLNEALDTIDRFEMTERNAFSRSEDSFRRGLAMFSSSSQAQLTQFVDKTFKLSQLFHLKKQLPTLIQEAQSAKSKIAQNVARLEEKIERARASGDNDALRRMGIELKQEKSKLTDKTLYLSELHQKQANLPKEIKSGKLFTQKAIISISTAIAVSALLSQLMSNLMADKDEEEWGEEFAYGVLDESLVNVFGMFPFIGQFYNALEFDFGNFEKKSYDMSFWLIDEWNAIADALNSFVALVDGTGTKTPARVARDFLYAIGQWFGIPTRNLYNAMNTVLKALPSADYTVDNAFSKGNYGSDLKKAIDAKDTELAETIVKLMMKDAFGTTDTVTVKTIRSLYEQGYTGVLPKTVSSSIKINGETYSMTAKQQKAFKAIYSQADAKVEQLIGKQSFKNLSAKVQADSIKWIYDYYYEKAKEELSGIENDSKKAIFAKYIPIETLAVAYCTARSLESDKDRQGNAVTGTKKAKVVKYLNTIRASAAEKYMILGYLGYAPVSSQAKALIAAFARKNGASRKEIEELLDECNIAA